MRMYQWVGEGIDLVWIKAGTVLGPMQARYVATLLHAPAATVKLFGGFNADLFLLPWLAFRKHQKEQKNDCA